MRVLSKELITQFDVNIRGYQYNRSNYYLETNKGKYILRKMNVPKEQILFEYEVSEYVQDNGFTQMARIYKNKKKVPYSIYKDKIYMMEKYIECEEVDFTEIEDLKNITRLLGKFHNSARGMESEIRNIQNTSIKNIYEYFEKRCIESVKLKKKISKLAQKTPFEILFLKDYREYEELEKIALNCIGKESCEELIKQAKENYTIIHNDYSYHAVSKMGESEYTINNLDNCTYNIQVIDLANLLTKIMQKNNWNVDLLKVLVQIYDSEKSLSESELKGLKAMLIFPEKYAGICNKYLTSKRRANYNMFELKWNNMLEYKKDQIEAAYKIQEIL